MACFAAARRRTVEMGFAIIHGCDLPEIVAIICSCTCWCCSLVWHDVVHTKKEGAPQVKVGWGDDVWKNKIFKISKFRNEIVLLPRKELGETSGKVENKENF